MKMGTVVALITMHSGPSCSPPSWSSWCDWKEEATPTEADWLIRTSVIQKGWSPFGP